MARKLDQYRGLLNVEQAAEGMNCARQNAIRLAEDAQLLYENGRFASACSLATLSIEEAGKISILRRLVCANSEAEVKVCWREYRSHTAKNRHWLLPDLVKNGARSMRDFATLFDEGSDHPELLDQVKQIGFYTDCLGKLNWSEPKKVIDQPLAKHLVFVAKLFATEKEITVAELRLWVNLVGPHLHGTQANAEAALEKWYAEMQQNGLAPEGENEMRDFIRGNLFRRSTEVT